MVKKFRLGIVLFCFLSLHSPMNAQKLEKVNMQDFTSFVHTNGTPALILYRSVVHEVRDNGSFDITNTQRIKIFDAELAKDLIFYQIPLRKGNLGTDRIVKFQATTYNSIDDKIFESKITSKDLEEEKFPYGSIMTFFLPQVRDGSVIEYSYTINTMEPNLNVDVQLDYPQKQFEYSGIVPDGWNLDFKSKGDLLNAEAKRSGKLRNETKISLKDIPAFTLEPLAMGQEGRRMAFMPILTGGFQRYSDEDLWNSLAEFLGTNSDFGRALKRTKMIDNVLPTSILSESDTYSKAQKILEFTQQNFRFNGKVGIFTEEGIPNLLKTRLGNSAEINLLLTMLFRKAGLKAYPVLVPDISDEIVTTWPSIDNLQHVISTVEFGGKYYFYDASNPILKVNELPEIYFNRIGLMLDDKKPVFIRIDYPQKSVQSTIVHAKISKDGQLIGTFKEEKTNLLATFADDKYFKNKYEFFKDYVNKLPVGIDEPNVQKTGNTFTYNFSFDEKYVNVGKKGEIEVKPLLFLVEDYFNYSQQKGIRQSPVRFESAQDLKKVVRIEFPSNYRIQNLPKPFKVRTSDSEISYLYELTSQANFLEAKVTMSVAKQTFPKEFFSYLKEVLDNALQAENVKVVAKPQ